MRSFTFLSFSLPYVSLVAAQYSIYQPKDQVIFGGAALTLTATAHASNFTNAAAYDRTVLNPPPVPNPVPTQIVIQLASSGVTQNISRTIPSSFMGFSIEMSVANQICESLRYSSFVSILTNGHLKWARAGTHFFRSPYLGHPHVNVQ